MSDALEIQIDQRAIARAKKTLEKYRGRPMLERVKRGSVQGARMLVPSVRAATPMGPTGNLRRSIRARAAGRGFGAIVGPGSKIGRHRHLVIRGHRKVTPGGRFTGSYTTSNDFVDRAAGPRIGMVTEEILKIMSEG